MNKDFASAFGTIGVLISISTLPVFAQGSIPIGTRKPPAPPKPGEEYSWVRKWCSFSWREYGLDHMMRCERLITSRQTNYVLASYGCGTSCRIYNKQIDLPQKISNGWLRVHVFSRIWLGKFNANNQRWEWNNEGFRSGPASLKTFWFAECGKGLFGTANTSSLDAANISSVYIESGKFLGLPKRTTVHAAIYDRWLKLCKFEASM